VKRVQSSIVLTALLVALACVALAGQAAVVKHAFVSAKADTADATLVQPSNWNDEHQFSGGNDGESLVRSASATDGAVWAERLVRPTTRQTAWINFFPGNQTPIASGWPLVSTSGSMSDGSSTDNQMTRFTHASASSAGPRVNVAIPLHRTLFDPTFVIRIRTGSDISQMRIVLGFDTSTITDSDGSSRSLVAFRYSTVAGDTNWKGVCNNGGVGTQQVVDTGVAVAVSTVYTLKLVISGNGTLATFTVNGSSAVTLSTNLPATTTGLFPTLSYTPQAAVSRIVDYGSVYAEWD
jgi:hypothetical protein